MEFITLNNVNDLKLIKDVVLHPLKINKDQSGILVETLRKDWPDVYGKAREFSMQYYSITPQGVARDEKIWHIHPNYQEDRFLVVKGAIIVAIADQREDSSTKNLLNLFFMKPDKAPYILLIPKNTLHGFLVTSKEEAILLNFPTGLYNKKEEGRIPHEEVNVNFSDGSAFNWNAVRNSLNSLNG